DDAAWVIMQVESTGGLPEPDFVALVADEVPAHVRAELWVDGRRVWPAVPSTHGPADGASNGGAAGGDGRASGPVRPAAPAALVGARGPVRSAPKAGNVSEEDPR